MELKQHLSYLSSNSYISSFYVHKPLVLSVYSFDTLD
nr:MAG TPA: hypothetical protein [Crassvirales sp.]